MEWSFSDAPVAYPEALTRMDERAAAIRAGSADELVWLLEHPPLYTGGSSARSHDLLQPGALPVYETGRGGQYTYHGPGQRIGYVMLDLAARGGDIRRFVWQLEEWLIQTLANFVIKGERRAGRVGVWVDLAPYGQPGREAKIAALGVRVRRGVSMHGVALNVDPDLAAFDGIVPCGVRDHGVTSLAALGRTPMMAEVDMALRTAFDEIFLDEVSLRLP
jgi:lipoyl(octanoyl) transferase